MWISSPFVILKRQKIVFVDYTTVSSSSRKQMKKYFSFPSSRRVFVHPWEPVSVRKVFVHPWEPVSCRRMFVHPWGPVSSWRVFVQPWEPVHFGEYLHNPWEPVSCWRVFIQPWEVVSWRRIFVHSGGSVSSRRVFVHPWGPVGLSGNLRHTLREGIHPLNLVVKVEVVQGPDLFFLKPEKAEIFRQWIRLLFIFQ